MYDIIIVSIFLLIAICFYVYYLYVEYTKESKMGRYAYLKVKEKFDMFSNIESLKKGYETRLKSGFFQIQYIDKCFSNEGLITSKLLNLTYNNIDVTNIILIHYSDNTINLDIELYTKTDSIYRIVDRYSFTYKINKKNDIIPFLNKLEIIKTIRDSVLEARKLDNLSGIEKNSVIKSNISKNLII